MRDLERRNPDARSWRRSLPGLVGAIVFLLALAFAVAAPAAANGSVGCQDNAYICTGGGYAGEDPWGYSRSSSTGGNGTKHNCTSYAAYRIAQNGVKNPGNLGDAGYWDDNARRYGIPVDGAPRVGDIAQWNSGHVAYVEEAGAGYIVTTDDNYGLNYTTRKLITPGTSTYPYWPDNFIHFGGAGATPVFYGDWDGNGTTTPGVVRRFANGALQWHLRNSNGPGPADMIFEYGSADTDRPIVGNWDGVGGDTIGITRAGANGAVEFHLRNYNSAGPASTIFSYGDAATDRPIVGNWDGVGGDTIGITRRDSNGAVEFHLRNYNSAGPASTIFSYGNAATDRPIVGNWDGVGGDTIGITRRNANGAIEFHLRNYNSAGAANTIFAYGAADIDQPIAGNWDGVGGDTIGVARKSYGTGELQWHLRNYNSAGPASGIFAYGSTGEII